MTEELEATLGRDEERYEETELRETLERLLTREELDITQALVEGFTQAEIARGLGITQQAVAARVKKSARSCAARSTTKTAKRDEGDAQTGQTEKSNSCKNTRLV